MFNVALLGPPGAGKGTQARLLTSRLGIPSISMGDLLRELSTADTPLGWTIRRHQAEGLLVPDRLVLQLIAQRVRALGRGPMILDGFPRTPRQAAGLDRLLAPNGLELAVELRVSPHAVGKRLSQRGRGDDSPHTITKRLEVYEGTSVPTMSWYRSSGRLVTVDADRDPEVVHDELVALLREREREAEGVEAGAGAVQEALG